MPNDNYTHLVLLNDVSGSMDGVYPPFEDAMHLMLEQQARKLAGYLTVDVFYFDDSFSTGPSMADPMTVHLGLYAAGGTYMYTAIRTAIKKVEESIGAMEEHKRPGNVVFVIMSDGSSSGDPYAAADRVKQKRSDGWNFAFLSAGEGAMRNARLGLPADSMIYDSPDAAGVARMAERLGGFVSMARSGENAHF